MELFDVIEKRQSVRKFKDQDIPKEDLLKILDAGRVAPSGKNSQNWHFIVIKDKELKEKIGRTIADKNEKIALEMDKKDEEKGLRFRKFVKNFTLFFLQAPVLIVVYATTYLPSGYHELSLIDAPQTEIDKLFKMNPGMQNIGAALENMTLAAIDLGYGSCWLTGQNYAADEIEALLKEEIGFQKEGYFFTCMLPVGIPDGPPKSPKKKPIDEIATFVG